MRVSCVLVLAHRNHYPLTLSRFRTQATCTKSSRIEVWPLVIHDQQSRHCLFLTDLVVWSQGENNRAHEEILQQTHWQQEYFNLLDTFLYNASNLLTLEGSAIIWLHQCIGPKMEKLLEFVPLELTHFCGHVLILTCLNKSCLLKRILNDCKKILY